MKQHAIPQNILDVEFKLFTKFTVREFLYVATGVVIGGAFLLMYARNSVPKGPRNNNVVFREYGRRIISYFSVKTIWI